MNRNGLLALIVTPLLALFAAACASTAESPQPSVRASASAAPSTIVSPTTTACPTPPSTPPASLHYQSQSSAGAATLTGVKTETQDCFDRVTFTFSDNLPGYDAQYVQNWTECGSGAAVSTAGAAQLAITFIPANAHTDAGQPTITEKSLMPSYPSIKEAKLTCDFEAHVSWVFGTEERYFNVSTSQSPPQLVLDVYH